MKTAALIPVKHLHAAKRRLREELARRDERTRTPATRDTGAGIDALVRAMLEDVLDALRESSVASVYALTEDPEIAEIARAKGARTRMTRPDPGLNAILDHAESALAEQGFEASLVIPADLPLITTRHVEALIEIGREHRVVVVPATDGGTALLWRRPPGCIPARFGSESARAHADAARAAGSAPPELSAFDSWARTDLDTLEDARAILASGRPCRTLDILRELLA